MIEDSQNLNFALCSRGTIPLTNKNPSTQLSSLCAMVDIEAEVSALGRTYMTKRKDGS